MTLLASTQASLIGGAVCALSFVVVALFGALSRLETKSKGLFLAASLLTAAWGAALFTEIGATWTLAVEIGRAVAWMAFVGALLKLDIVNFGRNWRRLLGAAAGILGLVALAGVAVSSLGWVPSAVVVPSAELLLSVAGLVLLENLFRACGAESRWGLKYICFGLGAVFVYDFFYFATAVLTLRFDPDLDASRGFVAALAAPFLLLALRRDLSWPRDIAVSRQVVFRSAVLLACGVYLLAMSAAGTFLRSMGGNWGPVLQGVFLVAAVLTMLVAFSSAMVRGRLPGPHQQAFLPPQI